uniref:DNA-directed RNA polymerases I and III subunit RPAC2 n=1 Tax=Oryza punctata TaxID=4537 RepID=A0A0E0MKI5_ORYPU
MAHRCPFPFLSARSRLRQPARPQPQSAGAASDPAAAAAPHPPGAMEHGSVTDSTASTFSIMDEDHTLANSVRFVLNQDPRVAFCGYSIPHPADNKVNIRVQTTGDPAKDVLKDSLQDLMLMCQHVRGTFDTAVTDFRRNNPTGMNIDQNKKK